MSEKCWFFQLVWHNFSEIYVLRPITLAIVLSSDGRFFSCLRLSSPFAINASFLMPIKINCNKNTHSFRIARRCYRLDGTGKNEWIVITMRHRVVSFRLRSRTTSFAARRANAIKCDCWYAILWFFLSSVQSRGSTRVFHLKSETEEAKRQHKSIRQTN